MNLYKVWRSSSSYYVVAPSYADAIELWQSKFDALSDPDKVELVETCIYVYGDPDD